MYMIWLSRIWDFLLENFFQELTVKYLFIMLWYLKLSGISSSFRNILNHLNRSYESKNMIKTLKGDQVVQHPFFANYLSNSFLPTSLLSFAHFCSFSLLASILSWNYQLNTFLPKIGQINSKSLPNCYIKHV